jgi:WD40 repeat protein
MVFSDSGTQLLAGGRAGFLSLWDVEQRQLLAETHNTSCSVVCVGFTPEARSLRWGLRSPRYGGDSERLLCWSQEPIRSPALLDWSGELESAAYSCCRDEFAIASQNRSVELWPVGGSKHEPFAWMPARVRAMSYSPQENKTLAVASGRLIQLFDVATRQSQAKLQGHRGDVLCVAFSNDGQRLLSGGIDRTVRLWDIASERQLAAWNWELGAVNAIAFAPDGMTAAAGGDKQVVIVWDIDD